MYRLTNLTQDTTTTYKNKDLVYQALERENAKAKHQEAEGMLLVEELDKKGVVIVQEDIFLPFDGIADSLFLKTQTSTTPETMNKEKTFSFLRGSKDTNDRQPSVKEQEEPRMPVSDTPSHSETPSRSKSLVKTFIRWGLGLVVLIGLTLAGLSITLVSNQTKQVMSLSQQVKQLENLQSETGKLDAFVRYFLPNYYSEQGELDDFVSPQLDLRPLSGQLQSVILESTAQTGDKTYQLTYVLALKDGETRKQKRLTLTLKAVSSAPYGYQVIKEPKQRAYPN